MQGTIGGGRSAARAEGAAFRVSLAALDLPWDAQDAATPRTGAAGLGCRSRCETTIGTDTAAGPICVRALRASWAVAVASSPRPRPARRAAAGIRTTRPGWSLGRLTPDVDPPDRVAHLQRCGSWRDAHAVAPGAAGPEPAARRAGRSRRGVVGADAGRAVALQSTLRRAGSAPARRNRHGRVACGGAQSRRQPRRPVVADAGRSDSSEETAIARARRRGQRDETAKVIRRQLG